ncbi:PadR family transcriptional regulator [Roseibium alexandrii]|uniref:PadR family transcriptional regulator n=1 Tax=Roseibium alexandrii TaxID=388408 RepID=UPI0005903CB7|nr:PadR family transcriptional regulator [Roseibium alexandrii]
MKTSSTGSDAAQIQLKKGALELCVLAMLSRRESYAYEISSTLADAVGMGESTIYPLMRRMAKDGFVASRLVETSSGPSRKYYTLTKAGWQRLEEQKSDWRVFIAAVNGILGESQ